MADSISELPDDILFLILSFLPTEIAIATSLVSKRWKSLWLSVPTLNFDEERYLERSEKQEGCYFVDFVCATLQARGSRQPIKGFRLLTFNDHEYHMKQWLNKAIQGGVENVEVGCEPDCDLSFELPSNIYRCTTLVVLKLHLASFENGISSVYLPSLKTLHLDSCGCYFLKPRDFMELIYGCPILENLVANDLLFDDSSFEGELKSLSKLVRAEVCNLGEDEQIFHIPVKVFSNVKFMRLNQCDEGIPVFPNLIHVELVFGGWVELKWNSVFGILQRSPNLQKLVLDFEDYSSPDWPNPQIVPECFSSQFKTCILANYTSTENQTRFAKYVMQNSTSVRAMTIICSCYANLNDHQKMLELALCPRSSTCQLLFK